MFVKSVHNVLLYMNGECNATNVQGKNYNLHKLQGGHVPQCPIAGDATGSSSSWMQVEDLYVQSIVQLTLITNAISRPHARDDISKS